MNASAILIGQHNNLRFAGHDCIYLGFLHVAVRSEYYPTTRRDLLDPDTIISVIIEMNCMKRAARYLELANRIAALTILTPDELEELLILKNSLRKDAGDPGIKVGPIAGPMG